MGADVCADGEAGSNPINGGISVFQPPPRRTANPASWATTQGLVVCDTTVSLADVAGLDIAAEVCCVEPGEYGSWTGLPSPPGLHEEGFCLRPLAGLSLPSTQRVVPIPEKTTHRDLALIPQLVGNEVFCEVRYGLRRSALPSFHFDDVRDGLLRMFVIPDDEAGEHRIVAVAEEDAIKHALTEEQSREQARLIRFLHAAAAPPDRWATTISARSPREHAEEVPADGDTTSDREMATEQRPLLFAHQAASVEWMAEAERPEVIQAYPVEFASRVFGNAYEVNLPPGGVLAHPPGAGKTRIVAAFVEAHPTPTTVLCPPHLVEFWRTELALQAPSAPAAVVVPFGTKLDQPGRLVIDEPQDLDLDERLLARRATAQASAVWLVCGTARANTQLLGELYLGRQRCSWARTHSEFAGEPMWPYVCRRFLADPPAFCLPRPELETVEVSVAVGVEGIDAAVAGLSGYLMDQLLYLTFGRVATAMILERARLLEEMGFGASACHEITLDDWDTAVAQRSERRMTETKARLAELEAEHADQQQAFANRDEFAALGETPAILHIDGALVESAPAEWNAAWAGQTLVAEVGGGVLVSDETDCAGCCRRQPDAVLAVFLADEAAPIGYAPDEGAPPLPAVRIARRHAERLKPGARITLEVRDVCIVDEEAGLVSEEIARDGVEELLMREVQQLRQQVASLERAKRFAAQVGASLGSRASTSCPICLEEATTVAILPDCAHAFCRQCFERTVGLSGDPVGAFGCPVCRCENFRRDVVIFRHSGAGDDVLPQKLCRLLELLHELQGQKVLVFVQWAAHLSFLQELLSEHGVEALALAGDLPASMTALRRFADPDDSSASVLLLSFERHASGMNLQFCRHVIILHPYCPPTASDLAFVSMRSVRAYETQAIGRVRRYPQTGIVRVYRVFAACSIEEEIYTAAWNK